MRVVHTRLVGRDQANLFNLMNRHADPVELPNHMTTKARGARLVFVPCPIFAGYPAAREVFAQSQKFDKHRLVHNESQNLKEHRLSHCLVHHESKRLYELCLLHRPFHNENQKLKEHRMLHPKVHSKSPTPPSE